MPVTMQEAIVNVMVRVVRLATQPFLKKFLLFGALTFEMADKHRPDRLVPLDLVIETVYDPLDRLASSNPIERRLIRAE